jgi:hypothetical protein
MKSYTLATGTAFALIVVAHVWRAFVEGAWLLKEPSFIFLTGAAVGMSIWAWRVYRGLPRK